MAMKRKHRRLVFIVSGMLALGVAVGLVLSAFEENLVFFYSPTDLVEKELPDGRRFRLGGLVEEGSVNHLGDGLSVEFVVTDLLSTVPVVYREPYEYSVPGRPDDFWPQGEAGTA